MQTYVLYTYQKQMKLLVCESKEIELYINLKKNSRKFTVAIPVRKPLIERVFVRTG